MTEYVCHSCRDEFETEQMCDHFDELHKHQWCSECCKEFTFSYHAQEWEDLD
jgi:hypothetical protein